MGNPLRDRHALSELAEKRQVIEISDKIANLERLAGIVAKDLSTLAADNLPAEWRDSPVSGRLVFGYGGPQSSVPALQGSLAVTIDAVCQRCLEPFRLPLSTEFQALLGVSGRMPGELEGYELWELEDDSVRPIDVVDEALVMAMPLSAMHESKDGCMQIAAAAGDALETTMPFATLKTQMQDKGN